MICCLAVSPGYRCCGVAPMLMDEGIVFAEHIVILKCEYEENKKRSIFRKNESRFSSWAGLVPECKESAGCGHKVGNARSDHRGPGKGVVTRQEMQKYKITDGAPSV